MNRVLSRLVGIGVASAMLAACAPAEPPARDDGRPKDKPQALNVAVLHSDAGSPGKKVLSRARISTKSGDILILEPDGSVSEVALDTPGGRDAFAVSEADLAMLNENLGLDLGGVAPMGPVGRRGPTAQEKALAAFKARTQPLRLNLPPTFEAKPEDFRGAAVRSYDSTLRRGNSLVEVTANLSGGVDAGTAFAYATCALATWAESKGATYARHVRTLSDKRNGKMIVGSVFTLSEKKPMGLTVMTTKDTLQECKARGIPAA
ncbi:hypothetical protein ACEPPZ_12390 [Paracoccus yeei]|uniref:hypothetical protein n=1 Tax=Paracoccus yeei TaxID=147645 RepID=UPI0028D538C6|nr:hypothetical protein [Paracoccus yeei]